MFETNKPGWTILVCFLMGVLIAKMGYPVWTLEGLGVVGLMFAYGWAAK